MKTYTVIALLTFYAAFSYAQLKTEYYPNGTKKSEGVVIVDKGVKPVLKTDSKKVQSEKGDHVTLDGKWTRWYENGQVSSEEFYNKDIPTSTWKSYHLNGQVASTI